MARLHDGGVAARRIMHLGGWRWRKWNATWRMWRNDTWNKTIGVNYKVRKRSSHPVQSGRCVKEPVCCYHAARDFHTGLCQWAAFENANREYPRTSTAPADALLPSPGFWSCGGKFLICIQRDVCAGSLTIVEWRNWIDEVRREREREVWLLPGEESLAHGPTRTTGIATKEKMRPTRREIDITQRRFLFRFSFWCWNLVNKVNIL